MEVGGGQKLKKYIRIVLVLSCILALTACGNKKEIVLPEAKNITEIKIMDNASETANKIIDEKEISKLISESDNKKAGIEASYKPMVKINDEIYGWVRDLGAVKLGDIEFLGEIKGSKASLSKTLNDEDENFTSNIYPIGAKIYKWGEKSILIESNDIFSICEIIE